MSESSKQEDCKHDGGWSPRWDHGFCNKCGKVKVDRQWGVASGKWFDNLDQARFYKKNGFIPV